MKSIKNGSWFDASVWDTGKAPTETDDIVLGHDLTADRNIIIKNKLTSKKGSITFINVKEQSFVGGGMDPIASDVGLWAMGAGVLDLQGTPKTSWTTCNEVKAGSTTITVKDCSGWLVGDQIVVSPTEVPPDDTSNWDDNTNINVDSFFPKFERRAIKSISGNTITIDALKFNHLTVDDTFPHVANLTRDIKIQGTPTGRAHIFCCSHSHNTDGTIAHNIQKHTIKYVEISHMGPRHGGGRTALVLGRYALHFHHGGTGTEGTIVEGCSIHDIGNRGYVPHMSHGITMRKNVCFNSLETQFFWDWQEISHRIVWDGNLMMASLRNGVDGSCRGMILSMGDDNIAINNVAIYCHNGDPSGSGAYTWDADNEAVWFFENNISISCRTGLWV